jgi:hypothetical protein
MPTYFGHGVFVALGVLGKSPFVPVIVDKAAACLDFSVARNGYLTAYKWSGERELSNENLVYVPAEGGDAVA